MNVSLVRGILMIAALGWSLPVSAKRQGSQPPASTANDAVTGIARMLQANIDLSWLLSPYNGQAAGISPEVEAEARTIVQLADVARARGIDQTAATRSVVDLLDTVVLAEAARRALSESIKVGDADVAAMLKARPGRYDEYRLSHIFIAVGDVPGHGRRTEEEAQMKAVRLERRIAGGEKFADLARRESDDASTAADGGELSSMFGRYMADEFFPYASKLKAGEVSQPVRGKSGYHIIRLDERFPATIATARFLVTQDISEERMPALIADAVQQARQ